MTATGADLPRDQPSGGWAITTSPDDPDAGVSYRRSVHNASTKAPTMTLLQSPPTSFGTTVAAASARGATKAYGAGDTKVLALDRVDIDFAAGQFTAIMGPSGSGKSTLMHCMAGLDRLTAGSVTVGDVDITTASEKQLTRLRRDRLGFIFQAFNLVPTLTAIENITLPMDLGHKKPDRDWLDHVIATVGLSNRLQHRPRELSGGQQQRVAVARALASRPQIIFADEPTGNLDSATAAEILAFMRHAVRELGQTIVMVTHDPVAASYSHRVVFLADGRITDELRDPTSDAVFDHMRRLSN
jgi:putative ABC transport system ATP-binding protein